MTYGAELKENRQHGIFQNNSDTTSPPPCVLHKGDAVDGTLHSESGPEHGANAHGVIPQTGQRPDVFAAHSQLRSLGTSHKDRNINPAVLLILVWVITV